VYPLGYFAANHSSVALVVVVVAAILVVAAVAVGRLEIVQCVAIVSFVDARPRFDARGAS